ncbi:NAD(P)/FAD-dependent oxidoreductase [Deltaproteobacteria bacterium TL4]
MLDRTDITIIGAGVVGLAIAQQLAKPSKQVMILEKNSNIGEETSSRNSEVIHAGIYYPQESLKAKLCVKGKQLLYAYCKANQVPFEPIGKILVATCAEEEHVLHDILQKAQNNGVNDLQWWSPETLKRQEPEVKATLGLFSPSTGIINTHQLMRSFLGKAEQQNAVLALKTKVLRIEVSKNGFIIEVQSENDTYQFLSDIVINSAGLHAQAVASRMEGFNPQEIPPLYLCKGCYFSLQGKSPFSHLIYPVPEVKGTGLGIHATLDLAKQVRFGPDTEYVDEIEYHVPQQKQTVFYHAIKRYFPSLTADRLSPAYAGIRPKLQAPGAPVQDFVIQTEETHHCPGLIQCFGIESPGVTASLAIAETIEHLIRYRL